MGSSESVVSLHNRLTSEVRKACQCPTISVTHLVNNSTFSSYATCVLELLGTSPIAETRRAAQAQWLRDQVSLPQSFEQLVPQILPSTVDNSKPPGNVFLIGATGALGLTILAELLRTHASILVYCLAEAETAEEGRQQLVGSLKERSLWQSQWAGRLIPVAGSLATERFGLSDAAFTSMADDVGIIIVCPESNGAFQSYSMEEGPLVRSTKEAIRLALSKRQGLPASVHLASTLSVLGE